MANKRIKDLTTTAADLAEDDFIELDGATNGSRKTGLRSWVMKQTIDRAIREGIHFDGVSRGFWPMGTAGDLSASDWTLPLLWLTPPSANPSASSALFAFGPTNDPLGSGSSGLVALFETSGELRVYIAENYTTNQRYKRYLNFIATYLQGKPTLLHFRRSYSGNDFSVLVNGVEITPSAEVQEGTNPAWTHAHSSAYFALPGRGASTRATGVFVPFLPINRLLSNAECLAHAQTGLLPDSDRVGTGSVLSEYTPADALAYGAGDANAVSSGSVSSTGSNTTASAQAGARTGGAGAYVLRLVKTAGGGNVFHSWKRAGIGGQKVRYRFWARGSVATTGNKWFLAYNIASAPLNQNNIVLSTAWQLFEFDVITPNSHAAGTAGYGPVFNGDNSDAGEHIEIDDFQAIPLGQIADPVVQPCRILDDSKANGICGVLVGGTPLTARKDWRMRAIVDMSSTGNKQLFGAAVFETPQNHAIDTIESECAGAPTFSIGDGTTATKYTASVAHSAGRLRETLSAYYPADSAKTGIYANVTALHASSAAEKIVIRGHRTD